jgi:hypothetical protein
MSSNERHVNACFNWPELRIMVPVSKALDRLVEPNGNIHRQDFVFYKTEWMPLHVPIVQ